MTPISNAALVRRLAGTPAGKIILCNVLDGYQENLFTQKSIRSLFTWWCKALPFIEAKPTHDPSADPVLVTLDLLRMAPSYWADLDKDYPGLAALGSKPDFRLSCSRLTRYKKGSDALVTVMSTQAFMVLLADEVRDEMMGKGFFDTTCDGSSIHAALKDTTGSFWIGKTARADRLKPSASLGSPGNIFWFTTYDVLKTAIDYRDADGVRDLLGLIHHDSGVDLIGIAFSANALRKSTHGRPTVMDAGSHRRHKTWTFISRNRNRSAWGFTAHLEKLAVSKKYCDGAPERVALSVDSADIGAVVIYPFGRTTTLKKRGLTSKDNDEAFAEYLYRARDFKDIKTAVLALL